MIHFYLYLQFLVSFSFVLAVSSLELNRPPDKTIIGYDCGSLNTSITTVSLVDTKTCSRYNETISERVVYGQVVSTQLYKPVHVYNCLIAATLKSTYCGSLHLNFDNDKPIFSSIVTIGRSQCEELHKTGNVVVHGHKFKGLKTNHTNHISAHISGSNSATGDCTRGESTFTYPDGHKAKDYMTIFMDGTVTLMDSEETLQMSDGSVILEKYGLNCPGKDQYCDDGTQGEVFWYDTSTTCIEDNDVLYEGEITFSNFRDSQHVSTSVASIDQGGKTFALKITGSEVLCGQVVIGTEHGRVKIVEKPLYGYVFKSNRVYNKNVDLSYYVDTKFLYVTSSLLKRTNEIYDSLLLNICAVQKKVLENRLILAQLKSDQIGSLLDQRRGVSAHVQGEMLYIIKCIPVPVTYRKTEECTQEFPIWYNEKSFYLQPITHLIVSSATKTMCSPHMQPSFKLLGSWYTYYKGIHKSPMPKSLDPNTGRQDWKFQTLLDISMQGLYDKDDMDSLQRSMMFGATRDAISTNYAKVSFDNNRDGSRGFLDTIDDEGYDRIGSKIGGWMWRVTSLVGSWFGFLIMMFLCLKGFAFCLDVCINSRSIYKRMGWTLWLLAAPLNGLMHILNLRFVDQSPEEELPRSNPSASISVLNMRSIQPRDRDLGDNQKTNFAEASNSLYPHIEGIDDEDVVRARLEYLTG